MSYRASRKSGTIRAISLALLLLGSAAVLFSIYQVAVGHSEFSWVWLMALLPAAYGAYLFGSVALKGHVPLPMPVEVAAEAEGAG